VQTRGRLLLTFDSMLLSLDAAIFAIKRVMVVGTGFTYVLARRSSGKGGIVVIFILKKIKFSFQ